MEPGMLLVTGISTFVFKVRCPTIGRQAISGIGIVADSRDGGHAIFGGLHADPDYWYWLERVKSVVFDAFCAEDSSLRVMNHLGLILQ